MKEEIIDTDTDSMKEIEQQLVKLQVELTTKQEESNNEIANVVSDKEVLKQKVVELESEVQLKQEEMEFKMEPIMIQLDVVQKDNSVKQFEIITLQEAVQNVTSEKELLKQKVVELESDLSAKEVSFESEFQLKLEPIRNEAMALVRMESETKQTEIVAHQATIEAISSEREVLKQKVVELETDLETKQNKFESILSLQMEPLQREMQSIKHEKEATETALKEEIVNASTEKEILRQKVVELDTDLKTKVDEFETEMNIKLDPLRREMQTVQMQIAEKQSEVVSLQESISMINSEKEVLKEKVVELETDLEVREEEFSSRAQLQVAAVMEELNSAKMEEIEELLQKLKAAESTITESITAKDMLQGKLVEMQGELAVMAATVEQLNQCKAELKELVLVMQEKEQVERELRHQVLELQEQVKEQGSGKESLVASLEAAQQQVEMAMVTRAAMELDLKDSKEAAEEATKTALVRLEKCKTVELEVEEMAKEKEQLGVKSAR